MPNQEAMLLERYIRCGDAEAFSEIVRQYAGIVYGTCQRILGDRELAADAVQETFFQLVKHPGQVRESLLSWLHRVATHKAIDRIRRDSNRRRHEKEYVAGRLHQTDQWQEISPFVDEAIDELDEPLRRILTSHFLHGQTMNRIAETEQVSQATISRRVETALDQLRTALERRGILVAAAGLGTMLVNSVAEAAPTAVLEELGKMAMVGGTTAVSGSGAAAAVSAEAATASASVAGTAAGFGVSSKLIAAAIVAALGTTGYVIYYNQNQSVTPTMAISSSASEAASARMIDPATNAASALVLENLPQDKNFETGLETASMDHQAVATEQGILILPTPSEAQQGEEIVLMGGASVDLGAGMGALSIRFDTPSDTVTAFVTLLEMGYPNQLSQCFVEGAQDAIQLQELLENPKNQGEIEFKQCLESLGSPVDITRQVQGSSGLEVTWLCTVNKPFAMNGGSMSFQPGDKFELDATLVQVGSEWKMSGI